MISEPSGGPDPGASENVAMAPSFGALDSRILDQSDAKGPLGLTLLANFSLLLTIPPKDPSVTPFGRSLVVSSGFWRVG